MQDAQEAYLQSVAADADALITKALAVLAEAHPLAAQALTVGALMAAVRFYADKTRAPDQKIVTRDLVVALTPPLHWCAEVVVKSLSDPPAETVN